MITFPNCKINLGLNILSKNEDGFHGIETCFFPVKFHDVLEIIPSQKNETQLTVSGISAGEIKNNICFKAYDLIKKDYPQLPAITMHLHKTIPLGAGLGGGSADGTAALQLINIIFKLNIAEATLFGYALRLGSDCPFFLLNRPCLASGRGQILEPLKIDLSGYKIIIVNPGIHSDTAEAFKNITPVIPAKRIKEIIRQPMETWKKELTNDFEKSIFNKFPAIRKIKEDLYEGGATYASLSGSGSSVYGIFEKNSASDHSMHPDYFYKIIDAN